MGQKERIYAGYDSRTIKEETYGFSEHVRSGIEHDRISVAEKNCNKSQEIRKKNLTNWCDTSKPVYVLQTHLHKDHSNLLACHGRRQGSLVDSGEFSILVERLQY